MNLHINQIMFHFLQNVDRRRQIHVRNLTFNDGESVATMLINDVSQSIPEQQLQILLNNYKILVYNGL